MRPQEAPGGPRRSQETPGGPRRPQEAPGGPRSFQEATGGPRSPESQSCDRWGGGWVDGWVGGWVDGLVAVWGLGAVAPQNLEWGVWEAASPSAEFNSLCYLPSRISCFIWFYGFLDVESYVDQL